MNRLEAALGRVASELQRLEAAWALVGGLAVSARTEPRFTRDLDIAVAVEDDEQAEWLVGELRARGYRLVAGVEQERTGRLATVRLHTPSEPTEGIVVDLLFASSGIEPEIVAEAEPVEIAGGLTVPVAGFGHLLATKLLAEDEKRPQDRADAVALLEAGSEQDLALARRSLELISERGYARGRDLGARLRDLQRGRPPRG